MDEMALFAKGEVSYAYDPAPGVTPWDARALAGLELRW